MKSLCYEQFRLLKILSNGNEREAFSVKQEADCSPDELFDLVHLGAITLREDGVAKCLYVTIADRGRIILTLMRQGEL